MEHFIITLHEDCIDAMANGGYNMCGAGERGGRREKGEGERVSGKGHLFGREKN